MRFPEGSEREEVGGDQVLGHDSPSCSPKSAPIMPKEGVSFGASLQMP